MNSKGTEHIVGGQVVLKDLESVVCVCGCKKFPSSASTEGK